MKSKKTEDVIVHNSLRERSIARAVNKMKFKFAIIGDDLHYLNGYAIVRLINIIMTSNRPVRALENFGKLVEKSEKTNQLPDWNKSGAGIIDQEN